MKLLTSMALLGYAFAAKKDIPVACEDDKVVESDCTRTMTINDINLTYWVNLQSKIPYFHGRLEIPEAREKLTGSNKYAKLRICLELGREGREYAWRE